MAFLFRSAKRTAAPSELVLNCRQTVLRLDNVATHKAAAEETTKLLQQMKAMYFGDAANEPNPDRMTQMAQEVYISDLLPLLIANLDRLEFEAKKDVVSLFNSLLRRQIADRFLTVEYLLTKESTIITMSRYYSTPGVALQCGQILRECIRHESLAKVLLIPTTNSDAEIWNYFDYVEKSTFDVASDAFSTLRGLLTTHKALVAEFLQTHYDQFFKSYQNLLTSTNYVWKRQSLKLLGEILLDRVNFNIMSKYIQSTENLKLMMNLLRDRSSHIQFEAFHVFKVFVANPKKAPGVRDILVKNQEKLLHYLADFHNERKDDEQFADEKRFIIQSIKDL